MDLLEYQGKQLFARHDIPVPTGAPATTVADAVAAADEVGYPCVVKAQVLIGGRGKAGGIKLAKDRHEAEDAANAILGMDIRGFTVHEVWVEAASDIAAELYASIVFDRSARKPLVMLSTQRRRWTSRRSRRPSRRRSRRCTSIRSSASRTSTPGGSRSTRASTPTSCARSARCSRASTRRSSPRRRCSSRSTRSSSPATARSARSTRRSRSTTTRSSATRTTRRCATPAPRTRRSRWPRSAASRT